MSTIAIALITCLSTIIMSKCMYIRLENAVMIDLANDGYKIMTSVLEKRVMCSKRNNLLCLIPGYNLVRMIDLTRSYNKKMNDFLESIETSYYTKRMDKLEQFKYKNNPNLKTIKSINDEFDEEMKSSKVMEYIINDQSSCIYYKTTSDGIEIVNVTGPMEEMKEEKVAERVKTARNKMLEDGTLTRVPIKKNHDIYAEDCTQKINEPLEMKNNLIKVLNIAEDISEELTKLNTKEKTIGLTKQEQEIAEEYKKAVDKTLTEIKKLRREP